jgi:hypothetical protein
MNFVMLPKLPKFAQQTPEERYAAIERKLINREAQIGAQLFGPIPKGHQRQFFCMDEKTWVWYETWTDEAGQRRSMTTRYDVRPNGILKVQNGRHYSRLSRNEARNLARAVKMYQQRVYADYDRMLQTAA